MNIAFFYRTRKEYDEVAHYVQALNLEKQETTQIRINLLRLHTRYRRNENDAWDAKIPKARPGTKKYLAIISGNKRLMKICDVQPEEFLEKMGREIVSKIPHKSKYDGERTTHSVVLQTHQEFCTITSVFNKRYGHGNWRIQGPKRLQYILKKIEPSDDEDFFYGGLDMERYKQKYSDGVRVTLVVNEPDANIEKQLFKAVLKG